jgi:hypothetical protein
MNIIIMNMLIKIKHLSSPVFACLRLSSPNYTCYS